MKLFILTVCVVLAVVNVDGRPGSEADSKIIAQELDLSPDGAYQWAYASDNGISASATGEAKKIDADTIAQVVQGQSSYKSPEGDDIVTQYLADENGYQPQGAHLPTPPPIPEAILRGLEYIRAHPPPAEKY